MTEAQTLGVRGWSVIRSRWTLVEAVTSVMRTGTVTVSVIRRGKSGHQADIERRA